MFEKIMKKNFVAKSVLLLGLVASCSDKPSGSGGNSGSTQTPPGPTQDSEQIKQLQTRITALEQERDKLRQEKSDLEKQLQQMQASSGDNISGNPLADQEKTQLKNEIQQLKVKIQRLESEKLALANEKDATDKQLNVKIQQLERKNEELSRQLQEEQNLVSNLKSSLSGETTKLANQIQTLNENIANKNEEIAELKESLKKEKEEKEDKIKILNKEKNELCNKITQFRTENISLKAKISELGKKIKELTDQNEALTVNGKSLNDKLQELNKCYANLNSEKNNATAKITELTNNLKNALEYYLPQLDNLIKNNEQKGKEMLEKLGIKDIHSPYIPNSVWEKHDNIAAFLIGEADKNEDKDEIYHEISDAITRGKMKIIRSLIEKNYFDVNYLFESPDSSCNFTFLTKTAQTKHLNIFNYLIQKKGDLTARDNQGRNPLFFAAQYGMIEIIKAIHSALKKADKKIWDKIVNVYDNNGFTPLLIAIKNKKFDSVKFLIQNGADVDAIVKASDTDYIVDSDKKYRNKSCLQIVQMQLDAAENLENKCELEEIIKLLSPKKQ